MEEERITSIVVLAHPGSEPLVNADWERFCDWPFVGLTWDGNTSVKQLLEDILAGNLDGDIAQRFVIIPANLIPVSSVRWSELQTPYVDVDGSKRTFWGRVPVTFDKEILTDFLPENDSLPDEEFVKAYVEGNNGRALEVSHGFGNFYTKILRENPCQNVVIEGMLRKRYLFANPAGWSAITGLLKKMLKL